MDEYKKRHHFHPEIFACSLKIGEWKYLFEPGYFKLLIAGSLNEVVREKEFHNSIAGYLLSDRRLYLVLATGELTSQQMLACFYEKLMEVILLSFGEMKKIKNRDVPIEEPVRRKKIPEPLFTEHPLKNNDLVRLITGRDVKLPYYNASLERLKSRIRNYPFCSAIDYGGGESPLLVRVITEKEWQEIEYWKKEKHRT